MDVVLADYGAGNLASVAKALAHLGCPPRIVRDAAAITGADAIVIPGVGHFDRTRALVPWRAAVLGAIDQGVAVLGICLGLQWLYEGSDEAPGVTGLGVFPGRCFRLGSPALEPRAIKVPHVGWSTLAATARRARLLDGLPADPWMYFTHSFAAPVVTDTVATTSHGRDFSSVVERDRVFATQFHPEKSGAPGLRVLANFLGCVRDGR